MSPRPDLEFRALIWSSAPRVSVGISEFVHSGLMLLHLAARARFCYNLLLSVVFLLLSVAFFFDFKSFTLTMEEFTLVDLNQALEVGFGSSIEQDLFDMDLTIPPTPNPHSKNNTQSSFPFFSFEDIADACDNIIGRADNPHVGADNHDVEEKPIKPIKNTRKRKRTSRVSTTHKEREKIRKTLISTAIRDLGNLLAANGKQPEEWRNEFKQLDVLRKAHDLIREQKEENQRLTHLLTNQSYQSII